VDLPDPDPGRARAPRIDSGEPVDPVRQLAEQLRLQGVVVVASRALAAARPGGVDLLGALPVLARELAHEWRTASQTLPMLDADRLQTRSAAALLIQGAAVADGDAVHADELDLPRVARAVNLRSALSEESIDGERAEDRANLLLDRTWAVLCDIRAYATAGLEGAEEPSRLAVVPSAAEVSPDDARQLAPALHRAACAGALVGLLAPWLPPARVDGVGAVDSLLEAVSAMARAPHDRSWWSALARVGRVAASLSVACAYAAARHSGAPAEATALTLSEPALGVLVEQARSAAMAAVRLPGAADAPATAGDAGEPADTRPLPQASPSQQARAAAERAAAERRATQQAFVERAHATRAARAAHEAAARSGSGGDDEPAEPPRSVTLPPLAQVQEELGEDEVDQISLGVWDTLMRPR
jgi:hypothetical protein